VRPAWRDNCFKFPPLNVKTVSNYQDCLARRIVISFFMSGAQINFYPLLHTTLCGAPNSHFTKKCWLIFLSTKRQNYHAVCPTRNKERKNGFTSREVDLKKSPRITG